MNKEFYEKIIKTAQAAIDEGDGAIAGEPLDLTAKNEVGISGNTTVALKFDDSGNASGGTSQSCLGLTIDIDAYIGECPPDSVFDVKLDTNYSQHFSWPGVKAGQHVKQSIKTNFWSNTNIKVSVHSNKPGTTATAHIHYST